MLAPTQKKIDYPEAGELFAERYRIIELIGTGGYSRVYSARQQQLDRRVAVKILAPTAGSSRSSQEIIEKRFYREARLLSRLSGPNTITVYDYGRTSDGLLFMVSELIEGRNLKRLLEAEGPLEPARARRIFTQILLGLREVHSHGFLHRDIKPSNVMVFDHLGDKDRAKLLDFGIAKGVTVGASDSTALTMTGFVIGTPGYMSPEQALGRPVTRASDLFSAGLIAYEMLIGQSPFRGLSMEQLQRRLMSAPLRIPGTLRIADDFERVLNRVLSIDADERYETAAGALADLGLSDADYQPERDPRPSTPRPQNLLTFPLQLDSTGTTIVDTIADGTGTDATTTLLPISDTFENEAPDPLVGAEDSDATDVDTSPFPNPEPEREEPARRVEDVTIIESPAPEPQRGVAVWVVTVLALVVAVALLIWFLASPSEDAKPSIDTDQTSTPSQPEPSIPAASADPTVAIRAAEEILARSARNAELDAQIRAKERRLQDADSPSGEASEPDTEEAFEFEAPTHDEEPTRERARPSKSRPKKKTEPQPEPDTDPPKPKPVRRDFDVTPIDEL
jgi:serine/threonine protein kinase